MDLTQAQLDAIASIMTGVTPQGKPARKGKAGKATSEAISLSDLKAQPARTSEAKPLPANAMSTTAFDGTDNARKVDIYPDSYEGVKGVRFTGLPFKKSFVSLQTIRCLADENVQVLLAEFVSAIDRA